MVAHPRAPVRPHQFRTLNQPRPVRVQAADGIPRALLLDRRWQAVGAIQDHWRVEDQWWRQPLRRRYFEVWLEDGTVRTVFEDSQTGAWFMQRD